MLGLADRDAVFDLFEAVMQGKPAAALAITDRAYERGADLGVLLQDLLELTHTLTRLKSVPGLRDSPELPEAERTRGAALADALSIPVLGRAWQMLLKGVAEVEAAPDRRAAAEMVLIRLCHVADLPPPGDLVRRLTESGAAAPSAPMPAPSGAAARGRWRAARPSGRGWPPRPPRRRSPRFRDVVALAGAERRGDAARASAAFGASGALRPAGDRAAPGAGRPARPGGETRRPAGRGHRHALDHRALRRAGRADAGRAGRGGRGGAALGGGAIIRWCAPSWTRFPARASRPSTMPPSGPPAATPPDEPPADEMPEEWES